VRRMSEGGMMKMKKRKRKKGAHWRSLHLWWRSRIERIEEER